MRTLWLSLALAASAAAQVRFEDILKGPGDNWLTYAGDYRGQRHSALKQIDTSNAASLVPKWTYHVPKASGLRTNPIVHDGIMYITAPNEIRALDARSGRLIWAFKDPKSKKEAVNRGAAIMRQGLLRHHRYLPGGARPPYRRGLMVEEIRRSR
jgi:glucose dehydrogenase